MAQGVSNLGDDQENRGQGAALSAEVPLKQFFYFFIFYLYCCGGRIRMASNGIHVVTICGPYLASPPKLQIDVFHQVFLYPSMPKRERQKSWNVDRCPPSCFPLLSTFLMQEVIVTKWPLRLA